MPLKTKIPKKITPKKIIPENIIKPQPPIIDSDEDYFESDGRPEIAVGNISKKKLIVLGIAAVIVMIVIGSCSHHANKKQDAALVEETYGFSSSPVRPEQKSSAPMPAAKPAEKSLITEAQLKMIMEKEKELQARLTAPMMQTASSNNLLDVQKPIATHAKGYKGDPNTNFLDEVVEVSHEVNDRVVEATHVGPLSDLILQGSIIRATLEPATDSDLPGMLRAVVSEPGYAEDGSRILIPRGSRLVGEYKSGLAMGQSRIFVVWTRLITPDGISVDLGSPGTDSIGVAGMGADVINRHFWQRFGSAVLLSIIGAGVQNVGVESSDPYNAAQAYRIAVADSLAQSANESLKQTGTLAPTLYSHQGKEINVFVAHDLDFGTAMQMAGRKINVF